MQAHALPYIVCVPALDFVVANARAPRKERFLPTSAVDLLSSARMIDHPQTLDEHYGLAAGLHLFLLGEQAVICQNQK